MDNTNEETAEPIITVDQVFGNKNIITLYGLCPNCREFHEDAVRIRQYYTWLSEQSMINFN